MPLWLIEARDSDSDDWTVVTTEQRAEMALAVEAELELDGYATRSRRFGDIPIDSAQELLDQACLRSGDDIDQWEPYHLRAVVRIRTEEP
jgi:hypothetical protein